MAFRIVLDGIEREIDIIRRRPHLVLSINGREHVVQNPGDGKTGLGTLTIADQSLKFAQVETPEGVVLRLGGRTYSAELLAEGEASDNMASSNLHAPMPGAVVAIDVAIGDTVATGDAILTIESMKLQMVLSAPRAGIVENILVAEGESFGKDQLLANLADETEGDANA